MHRKTSYRYKKEMCFIKYKAKNWKKEQFRFDWKNFRNIGDFSSLETILSIFMRAWTHYFWCTIFSFLVHGLSNIKKGMCMKILRPTQNCKKKNIEKKPLQREKSNTGIYIKKGTKIGELPCRIIFLLYLTKNFLS